MTLNSYLFEGASAGTSATVANTGANTINKAGGSQTFTAAAATHGNCGLEITTTATGQFNIARFAANAANDKMSFSFTFSYLGTGTNNASTADTTFVKLLQVSTAKAIIMYQIDASDKFRALDSVSAMMGASNLKYQLVPGTQYRVETVIDRAATTAKVHLYSITGTQLGEWYTTSGNFNTVSPDGADFGCVGSNQAWTTRFDDIQFNDGGTTEIGAYTPASQPPTLSLPTNITLPVGTNTTTVAATASDPNGLSLTYAWSTITPTTGSPTLTNATSATVTVGGSAPNLVTLQCVVTNSNSLSVTKTVEVRFPVDGGTTVVPLPVAAGKVGTWNNVGGASTDGQALSDSSDTTYLESASVSATEQTLSFRWQPTASRQSGQLSPIRLGTDSGTANAIIRLVENGTVRQTWNQSITTTITDYTFTLSAGTISAITDWAGLTCQVGVTS